MAGKKSSKTSKSKKKSKAPKTYVKCVKQFSTPIAADEFECLMHDAEQYQHCRNYMYARYSGINSMPLLTDHRRLIRDELMRVDNETKANKKILPVLSWELPKRLWKLALDDAVGGIKSAQTNTINRVRDIVRKHDGLNEDEKHYCFWVLCSSTRLHHVLKHHALAYPDKIWNLKVDKRNLMNRIRRWFRDEKNSIPCSRNCTSYMIDSSLYKYGKDQQGTYIAISVYQRRGNRIRVYLRDDTIVSKGNLRLILHPESKTIEIHRTIQAKAKKKSKKEKKTVFVHIEGADKGMTEMLHLSNGHVYGKGLGKLIVAESDWIKEKWQKRNPYDAKARELEKAGNFREAGKIRETYLGRKAYNRHTQKFEGTLKTFINAEIRRMFQTENLKELVLEDLTWVSESMKKPKNMNRRLHHWTKGYLQERLEYYAEIYGVKITMINPAYTSKVCHKCGCSGIRKGKVFVCPHCGQMDADDNAAKNIRARKYDKKITLYTNKDKVKGILEARYLKKRNSTLPAVIPSPGSVISPVC